MSRHSQCLVSLTAFGLALALLPQFADAGEKKSTVEESALPSRYDERIRDYTEAIRLNPTCAENFRNRGVFWEIKKEYRKAMDDFSEAIRLDPNCAENFHNRGVFWHGRKEYDKAMKDFTEAIRLAPDNAIAYVSRGQAWHGVKEYDRALKDYTKAIRLNPNDAFGFLSRGHLWLAKKEYDKAIKDYDQVIRVNPNNLFAALALNARGSVWAKKREYERADKDFVEALRLAEALRLKSTDWILRDYAKFRATCPDAGYRDGKKAVEMARKACDLIEDGWQNWASLSALAAAYAEVANFDEAVRWQRQALEDATIHADARKDHEQRLRLYEAKQPYREP